MNCTKPLMNCQTVAKVYPTRDTDLSHVEVVTQYDVSSVQAEVTPAGYGGTPRVNRICCIGAGYVGGPTSAVIANKNPSIPVTVVDYDNARISAWQSDSLPIYEPGLLPIVQTPRDGISSTHNNEAPRPPNLFFSTDIDGSIAASDLILLSVNTPTKSMGKGAGHASELSYLEAAVRKIGSVATSDKIIVEKSTVPCRTAETLREILSATGKPGVHFEILSNPEFLAEGTAIKNLLNPDRILIGSLKTERGLWAARALAQVYEAWVDPSRVITINLWSSELAKLAANALLAQRISSINALSAICESVGADIDEVSHACGLDKRIGSGMLKASVGFGGSCFKKDILSLAYIAESLHLFEVANYWKSVVGINEYQKDRFTRRIVRCLYNSLSNKKLAVLGFSYKKDTGDTRETAAITVINNLVAEGARVSVYDPLVEEEQIHREIGSVGQETSSETGRVAVCSSAYEACTDADAVVILTEWDEFSNKSGTSPTQPTRGAINQEFPQLGIRRTDSGLSTKSISSDMLDGASASEASTPGSTDSDTEVLLPRKPERVDWEHISGIGRQPMFVFDGRNILDAEKLRALGFRVECIGK